MDLHWYEAAAFVLAFIWLGLLIHQIDSRLKRIIRHT